MPATASDYDGAWKEALDNYFPQFMALFWPTLHAQIDWVHKPVFLDKELQAISRSAKRGRRHVDKLVSLCLLGGQEALVLIHIEVQAKPRSEEHTSELQSLMRISYAVFCLKKKKK